MSVSSVSSASSSGGDTSISTSQLETQIQNLQKQIVLENASKTDDAKTKLQKVEQLQQEIQQVEAQLQQQTQSVSKSSAARTLVQKAPVNSATASNVLSSNVFLDTQA